MDSYLAGVDERPPSTIVIVLPPKQMQMVLWMEIERTYISGNTSCISLSVSVYIQMINKCLPCVFLCLDEDDNQPFDLTSITNPDDLFVELNKSR